MSHLRLAIAAVLLLATAARPTRADEPHRMKAAGIALVVVGSALTIAGAALVTTGIGRAIDNGHPNTALDDFEVAGGWSFTGVGQAAIIAGIPLWTVGWRRVSTNASTLRVRF